MDKNTVNKLLSVLLILVKAHLHNKEYKGQPVRHPIDLPDVPSTTTDVSNKRKQTDLPISDSKTKLPKQENKFTHL